ncbi:MAG: hypothetical protein CMM58_04075 [Rhodospirillaceae bacterium]|nr:hypothetical protein [Rhodospirillaceae bacterium]|tara:strand:- start:2283 stop:2543 length:261 start_codon:yes stop_codon:yes gene_type:complete
MGTNSTIFGRIMRLPGFDGIIPDSGPIHILSDTGDEYLLIAASSDTPGPVEILATLCENIFAPYIGQDVTVTGDILGSIMWNAKIA